ncbi:unnamed protein product [Calicophoron daubneyi]|uniref:Beta-lactamase-related domain-containing protein n=1 Tax=Calicophoron daubneyi TaxID=300641 RepID=A0AAV2TB08_CALDB
MTSFRSAIVLGGLCTVIGYVLHLYGALPSQMNGSSAFQYRHAVHVYKNLIQSGNELGSSFAVFHKNEPVINVYGGYMDKRFQLPWTQETVTQTFTLSLVSVPFTFALLIDRGLINLDDPVKKHLPAFSASDVSISDLLAHRSGYPYFIDQVPLGLWRDDYETVLFNISRQVPPIEPKHQMTHLHSLVLIADGLVRKLDNRHRTLAHFFMEEIAWPLGLDLVIGMPRSQLYRAARTYHGSVWDAVNALLHFDIGYLWTNLVTGKSMPYGLQREKALNLFSDYNTLYNMNPDMLEVPLASTNMFSNARSLARLFSFLSPSHSLDNGNSSGQYARIFSSRTLAWLLESNSTSSSPAYDRILHRWVSFTSSGLMIVNSPEGSPTYGMWDDIMGQVVFVDPKREISLAYTTNHAHGRTLKRDFFLSSLTEAVYHCLQSTPDTV